MLPWRKYGQLYHPKRNLSTADHSTSQMTCLNRAVPMTGRIKHSRHCKVLKWDAALLGIHRRFGVTNHLNLQGTTVHLRNVLEQFGPKYGYSTLLRNVGSYSI